MQKVYNLLGVLGFVMSGALVGASVVAFVRLPEIIENYTADMIGDITGNVTEMIPGEIDAAMPRAADNYGSSCADQVTILVLAVGSSS